ncbi:MAG: protein kinase, partial [Patescibacteria group bacterium]
AERLINALKYMHLSGVVHGDIKPQNIIIQPEDHMAVLVDYGFSAMRPTRDSDNRGYTEFFAPPEQLNKNSPLIPECDFYSLGMTMIYALSGGMDNVKRLRVPENVPEPVCDFIRKLIARDVLARPNWSKEDLFQTIQDVRTRAFGRARSQMRPIAGLY